MEQIWCYVKYKKNYKNKIKHKSNLNWETKTNKLMKINKK